MEDEASVVERLAFNGRIESGGGGVGQVLTLGGHLYGVVRPGLRRREFLTLSTEKERGKKKEKR